MTKLRCKAVHLAEACGAPIDKDTREVHIHDDQAAAHLVAMRKDEFELIDSDAPNFAAMVKDAEAAEAEVTARFAAPKDDDDKAAPKKPAAATTSTATVPAGTGGMIAPQPKH